MCNLYLKNTLLLQMLSSQGSSCTPRMPGYGTSENGKDSFFCSACPFLRLSRLVLFCIKFSLHFSQSMSDPKTEARPVAQSLSIEDPAATQTGKRVTAKTALVCCFVGALFATVHNVCRVGEHVAYRTAHGGKWNFTAYQYLEANGLYSHWVDRKNMEGFHILDEFSGIIGYGAMIPVISFITPVLARGTPGVLVNLALPCFAIAAGLRIMEWTTNAGVRVGTDWMATWPIMKPTAAHSNEGDVQFIQVLEMIYRVQRMRDLMLFASDYLFISVAMFTLSKAQLDENVFSRKHGLLGYVISFLGIFHFIIDMIVLSTPGKFGWMIVAGISRGITGVILIPTWFVWLGCNLKQTPTSELTTLLRSGNY